MFPHGEMQCVSPKTALVRHTNKVSVSQGCMSLAVVFVPLERESICPHERLTKLLINNTGLFSNCTWILYVLFSYSI